MKTNDANNAVSKDTAEQHAKEVPRLQKNKKYDEEELNKVMDELENGQTDNFYKFIASCEFPICYQDRLIDILKEPEFLAYINLYSFSGLILPHLATKRSESELAAYIKKHHYLGLGIYELAKRGSRWLNMMYLKQPLCNTDLFIDALTQVSNLDYAALSELYLRVLRPCYLNKDEENLINMLQQETHANVMAFLKQKKPVLSLYAEATLFFRNKQAEYETYIGLKRERKTKQQNQPTA